jgi:peptidoglycan/xylan/chitin deacetylase (PgdA/CDA1 family)
VSRETFREHIAFFASGAVDVVPLETLAAARAQPATRPQVALTFDDGFANLADEAFPLLAAHALPSTVFVVSEQVGRDNAWRGVHAHAVPTLPLLDWDALGSAQAQGVTIGAHTRTHPHLSQQGTAARADELDGCLATIDARLGTRPTTFAYPYGDVPPDADTLVGARFAVACTTLHRLVMAGDRAHTIPRLDAFYFRSPGALADWGSSAFRLRVFVRHALRTARRTIIRD